MSETISERIDRQFKNYQWRCGRGVRMSDPTSWAVPFAEKIAMDQALDQRSQTEWFGRVDEIGMLEGEALDVARKSVQSSF